MQKQGQTVNKTEQKSKDRQQVRFMAYQAGYINLLEKAMGGKR